MTTKPQILSREMILPAYKAAISPGPPPKQTPHPAQLASAIVALHLSSVLYKSTLFMQNKPNFRKAKMKLNFYSTRDYQNELRLRTRAKQTQSNPTCSELACTERSRRVEPVEVSNLFQKGYLTTLRSVVLTEDKALSWRTGSPPARGRQFFILLR